MRRCPSLNSLPQGDFRAIDRVRGGGYPAGSCEEDHLSVSDRQPWISARGGLAPAFNRLVEQRPFAAHWAQGAVDRQPGNEL
jgi:hypothetical protein